ncbi:hypothetical protein BFP97_04225 [Roseivirga sp. 4D4]|nr:hypothetical protein BFP97_04225 [Roseivirga sp. 4D4]
MFFMIIAFYIIPFLIVALALIDVLRNEFEGSNKLIWVLVIILMPVLGSILYYFIGRNQRIKR